MFILLQRKNLWTLQLLRYWRLYGKQGRNLVTIKPATKSEHFDRVEPHSGATSIILLARNTESFSVKVLKRLGSERKGPTHSLNLPSRARDVSLHHFYECFSTLSFLYVYAQHM